MRLAALMLVPTLCWALAAAAQDDTLPQDVRREMLRSSNDRDRQSEAFGLHLEQSQREMLAPPEIQPALRALHAQQRREFELLNERQSRDAGAPSWGPSLESSAQRERRLALERARRLSEAAVP